MEEPAQEPTQKPVQEHSWSRAERIRRMLYEGLKWRQIAERMKEKRTTCESFYRRMKKKHPQDFPLPKRRLETHSDLKVFNWAWALHHKRTTLQKIADEEGKSPQAIHMLIQRRRERKPQIFAGLDRLKAEQDEKTQRKVLYWMFLNQGGLHWGEVARLEGIEAKAAKETYLQAMRRWPELELRKPTRREPKGSVAHFKHGNLDVLEMHKEHEAGQTWPQIAKKRGITPGAARGAVKHRKKIHPRLFE